MTPSVAEKSSQSVRRSGGGLVGRFFADIRFTQGKVEDMMNVSHWTFREWRRQLSRCMAGNIYDECRRPISGGILPRCMIAGP
jgi:hypothetical protein